MVKIKFYDLAAKKSFTTDKYKIVKKSGRKFAVTKGPSGNEVWKIMGRA